MAESSKRTHQSRSARQLMYSNPPSGAGPTCSEDTEMWVTAKPSKRDQNIRNCSYVTNKEKAKAALAAATSSTKDYDVRYWRKSDEINDKMEASPSVGKPVMTEKRPSTSRLFEDSRYEEQFPCSEEIEAYLIHHLHVARFDSLWESIWPVEIFVKENRLTLRGTLQDKEMAIQKVYEHPLLKDALKNTLITFVPSLKSQDQEKMNKMLSKRYSSSTFLLKPTKCDSKFLLCSTNPTELLEAQEFLENMVQLTHTFKISQAVQVDKTKLNALLRKETQYPQLWDAMSTGEDCRIVTLASTSDEYAQVFAKFTETLAQYTVLDILRVQNKWIWERYAMTKSRMAEKNCGRINELELFHGSRTAPAERICKSEEGFDMRFSREGLWGQANYFAKDSRYSDSYAYSNKGVKEMMLAQVLTGDSYECKSDRSLRMPPMKNENETDQSKVLHRYDSVFGVTYDSKVYMTYCNENAYPAYILQYTAATDGHVSNKQHRASNHKRMPATSANVQHGRKVPLQASAQPSKTTNLAQGHPKTSSQSNNKQHRASNHKRMQATSANVQHGRNVPLQASYQRSKTTNLAQGHPKTSSQSNKATNLAQGQSKASNTATNGQYSYTSNQLPPQQQGLQTGGIYSSNYSFSSASNPLATRGVPMPSTLPAQQSYTKLGQSRTTTDKCVGGANSGPGAANTAQKSSCTIS